MYKGLWHNSYKLSSLNTINGNGCYKQSKIGRLYLIQCACLPAAIMSSAKHMTLQCTIGLINTRAEVVCKTHLKLINDSTTCSRGNKILIVILYEIFGRLCLPRTRSLTSYKEKPDARSMRTSSC